MIIRSSLILSWYAYLSEYVETGAWDDLRAGSPRFAATQADVLQRLGHS